jgi:hypothetical protein
MIAVIRYPLNDTNYGKRRELRYIVRADTLDHARDNVKYYAEVDHVSYVVNYKDQIDSTNYPFVDIDAVREVEPRTCEYCRKVYYASPKWLQHKHTCHKCDTIIHATIAASVSFKSVAKGLYWYPSKRENTLKSLRRILAELEECVHRFDK